MNPRKWKEKSFGRAAEYLAQHRVDPNVVTLVGLLLTLFAEGVALTKGLEASFNKESDQKEKGTGIFWLATAARILALVADGLDGSVARARKRIDPDFSNPNGSFIDGGVDRLVNTIRMMVESHRFDETGNQPAAVLAAATGVGSNLPSFLRAQTEARGGVTTEQSMNLLKFAGTHAGRTAIYTLISLEHSQVDQIISTVTFGRHITQENWDKMKQVLIGYVATSTAVVSAERANALVNTFKHESAADKSTQSRADSAGFQDKDSDSHRKRAALYLAALVGSGLWASVSLAARAQRKR